jgi:hypothetical protein
MALNYPPEPRTFYLRDTHGVVTQIAHYIDGVECVRKGSHQWCDAVGAVMSSPLLAPPTRSGPKQKRW